MTEPLAMALDCRESLPRPRVDRLQSGDERGIKGFTIGGVALLLVRPSGEEIPFPLSLIHI